MTDDPLVTRSLVIRAPRTSVFRYFTDSGRFARWWGEGSTITPRVGGPVSIRYPNGVTASGEVLEIVSDERITFSFGYDSGQPIPAGGSEVTITLTDHRDGTRLNLAHRVSSPAIAKAHEMGWRYQLAVFAHVVVQEAHAGVVEAVDRYFQAWTEDDVERRRALLDGILADGVEFRDAHGCAAGRQEVEEHIAAAREHLPGSIVRTGPVAFGHGVAVVDWAVTDAGGDQVATGRNVFELTPVGSLRSVVGLWLP